MSIKCMTRVWEHSRMKGSALLLELAIADHAHDDGSGAWPSQETLAKKTRLSVRQVRRLLDILVAAGELTLEERIGATALLTVLTGADNLSALPATVDVRPPRTDLSEARPECPPTPDTAMSSEPSSTVQASMNASREFGQREREREEARIQSATGRWIEEQQRLGQPVTRVDVQRYQDALVAAVPA
jgi:hypothetical protein